MKRIILMTGSATLALCVLTGCSSGSSASPSDSADSTTTSAAESSSTTPTSSAADPTASSATELPTVGAPTAEGAPPAGTTVVPPAGAGTSAARPAPPSNQQAATQQTTNQQTAAYAAKLCTSLAPLYTFKQQNGNPSLAGVTSGAQAKDLAVRLLTEGVNAGQNAINSLAALGSPPDPQAVGGVNTLVTSLRQGVASGRTILTQAQAVDPNDFAGLLALANSAKGQVGTSSTSAVSALKTGTGPAMAAALHNAPQCAGMGL